MFKRQCAFFIFPAFVLICFLSAVAVAQKAPASAEGAPLKGVDVKLGRAPGGQFASRTVDPDGKFDFGVLPAGSYYITFSLHEKPRGNTPENNSVKPFMVVINGAKGGTIKQGWDLKTARAFDPEAQTAAKSMEWDKIVFESDGVHPVTGTCQTVVKSKSNITNN